MTAQEKGDFLIQVFTSQGFITYCLVDIVYNFALHVYTYLPYLYDAIYCHNRMFAHFRIASKITRFC